MAKIGDRCQRRAYTLARLDNLTAELQRIGLYMNDLHQNEVDAYRNALRPRHLGAVMVVVKKVIMAPALVVAATSANAQSDAPLLAPVAGIWAIDNQSNCHVPSKTYSLSVSGEDGVITWMDGHGNTDGEGIIWSDSNEFRTMTVGSFHSGRGNRLDTGWTYSSTDSLELIGVSKVETSFYIVRCE